MNAQYRPPQCRCIGYSFDRLLLLVAMLKSRVKMNLSCYDVYLNIVGGLHVSEAASDLPVVMSLLSSLKSESLPSTMCFIGEIGLSGELRPIQQIENRLKTAASLGFQQCFIPVIEGVSLQDHYVSAQRENDE